MKILVCVLLAVIVLETECQSYYEAVKPIDKSFDLFVQNLGKVSNLYVQFLNRFVSGFESSYQFRSDSDNFILLKEFQENINQFQRSMNELVQQFQALTTNGLSTGDVGLPLFKQLEDFVRLWQRQINRLTTQFAQVLTRNPTWYQQNSNFLDSILAQFVRQIEGLLSVFSQQFQAFASQLQRIAQFPSQTDRLAAEDNRQQDSRPPFDLSLITSQFQSLFNQFQKQLQDWVSQFNEFTRNILPSTGK